MLVEKAKKITHKAHDSIEKKRKYTVESYCTKTTFAPDGQIVNVAQKFPYALKIYPEAIPTPTPTYAQ